MFDKKIKFIDEFKEAICSNICFSRKSTILLEAIYNNSQAAAILTNNKDRIIFNTFPSLKDDKINVFYDKDELFNWLMKEYLQIAE
jgi:hypothetical protein